MKTKLFKYFIYSILALAFFSSPLAAKDHHTRSKSRIKEMTQQRRQLQSSPKNSTEESLSKEAKALFAFSIDDKKNIVTVENKGEKATVQFPKQDDADLEFEIEDEELWVDYDGDLWQTFNVELWHEGKINISEELNEFIEGCELYGDEYTYEKKKKYAIIDITEYFSEEYTEDELNFDLENDYEGETYTDVSTDKVRIVITEKNIYYFFSELCETDQDVKLHEKFINSFKIK